MLQSVDGVNTFLPVEPQKLLEKFNSTGSISRDFISCASRTEVLKASSVLTCQIGASNRQVAVAV